MPQTSRRPHQSLDELGQTMAEYAMLIAFIAVLVAATLPLVAEPIKGFFTAVGQAFGG